MDAAAEPRIVVEALNAVRSGLRPRLSVWQCRWCLWGSVQAGRNATEERDECLEHEAECPERPIGWARTHPTKPEHTRRPIPWALALWTALLVAVVVGVLVTGNIVWAILLVVAGWVEHLIPTKWHTGR